MLKTYTSNTIHYQIIQNLRKRTYAISGIGAMVGVTDMIAGYAALQDLVRNGIVIVEHKRIHAQSLPVAHYRVVSSYPPNLRVVK